MEYVSPLDTRVREPEAPSARTGDIAGRRVWLLDIAKNRSAEFLDRTADRLRVSHDHHLHRIRMEVVLRGVQNPFDRNLTHMLAIAVVIVVGQVMHHEYGERGRN